MSDNDTPQQVIQLMLDGVESVLSNQPTSPISAPAHLQPLLDAQNAIGWEHLLRGRMAIQWSTHQQTHLEGPLDPKKNGVTWTTDMIHTVFTHFHLIWRLRNTDLHGEDWSSQQQAKLRQSHRELRMLYNYKGTLPPQAAYLLVPDIEVRLNWSGPMLRAWISSYRPIIEKNYTDEAYTID